MFRSCDVMADKTTMIGHKVSHSNIKTKRTFKPNLQDKTYISSVLGSVRFSKISTKGIRTIDKYGSIDNLFATMKPRKLADFAKSLQKKYLKKVQKDAK